MHGGRSVRFTVGLSLLMLILSVGVVSAQTPNTSPPKDAGNGPSNEQLQKLAWIRYLQGRSGNGGGGGVKRGVPQFVPFGGPMPFGNQMFQGGAMPVQTQAGGGADPDADQNKKSIAEKKADAQAAREEKKRKAKERAEKRKAELAERRAKAAPSK